VANSKARAAQRFAAGIIKNLDLSPELQDLLRQYSEVWKRFEQAKEAEEAMSAKQRRGHRKASAPPAEDDPCLF
jgi:hypothetical protein